MKRKIVLIGFVWLAAMALSGCGNNSDSSDLVGRWEFSNITQPAAPKIFFIGYDFHADGTLNLYNAADPIQVTAYTWSLNKKHNNIIDLNGADGTSQMKFRIDQDGLRIVAANDPLNQMNPAYQKVAAFSFSDLIEPDSRQSDLTAEQIVVEIKNKGLPIGEIRVVTEENDSSHLIGTPHPYTSKAVFADTDLTQSTDPSAALSGGAVEVYANSEDATNKWSEYTNMAAANANETNSKDKNTPPTRAPIRCFYRIGNVLLILDSVDFSDDQASAKVTNYLDALLEINQ